MTDYFALFDESRRPWLDAEKLKAKFLILSAQAHPDKNPVNKRETANQHFAELNVAFNCLREPKERLRHLLALELGERPKQVQAVPEGLMKLFAEIAGLRREVHAFLAESRRVESPLLRVQWFERAQDWTDRLRAVHRRLEESEGGLLRDLQTLDFEWSRLGSDPVNRGLILQRIDQIHQQLSFYTRWSGQLQETMLQLSF